MFDLEIARLSQDGIIKVALNGPLFLSPSSCNLFAHSLSL